MKKILFILIIIITSKVYSQVNPDSLKGAIDSLLSLRVEYKEYVKSASKYVQYYGDAPSYISIETHNNMKLKDHNSLHEVLSSMCGFYISYDKNYHYLGVRGFSQPTDYNNRVLILLDGHNISEAFYKSSPVGYDLGLSMFNMQNVEVVRGPGSTLFGASSMFANISITPRKIITGIIPEMKFSLGSFNTRQFSFNWGMEFAEDIHLFINANTEISDGDNSIYYKEFDSEESNRGIAKNLDERKTAGLFISLDIMEFQLSGFMAYYKKHIPTASWETDFNGLQKTIDRRQFLKLSRRFEISPYWSNYTKLFFDRYYYKGIFPYEEENETELTYADAYGFDTQFIWDLSIRNRTTFGIEFKSVPVSKYKYHLADTRNYINFNKPFNRSSFYLQNEHQFDEYWTLLLSARIDKFEDYDAEISPRLGIIYSPLLNHSLKLVYNKAYRIPTIYESDYFDIGLNYIANKNLKPEKLNMIQFIWEMKITNKFKSTFSVFNYHVSSLINQTFENDLYQFRNVGDTKAYGIETEIEYNVMKNFNTIISYTYQNAKEGEERISNSPVNLFKAGILVSDDLLGKFFFEYNYNSKRKTVYNSFSEAFNQFNISYNSNLILDKVSFSFSVKNLLDETIEYPGGFEHLQHTINDFGRTFILSVYFNQ